ncbi:hypothetical protein [Streptomyces sp. NBC_00212]|uniref:hypothetical protein n=1 Tax=Streptomyces sp. NBC_00212 TaxID=2975684 RepID=UPI003246A930
MKHALRTTLAGAVAAVALAVAVPPAVASSSQVDQPTKVPCFDTLAPRGPADPARIGAGAYNQARSILAVAGSQTAAKSHPAHGVTSVPVRYGTSLLACARDEFRHNDRNAPRKQSGMTPYHYIAIHDAARTMGITRW